MSHTPGPWKQYEGYGADYRMPVITDSIPDRDGKCVANCICYVATTNNDAADNAKLIAAAPDLLDALHWIVLHLEHRDGLKERFDLLTKDERKYLQDTLTKARGK